MSQTPILADLYREISVELAVVEREIQAALQTERPAVGDMVLHAVQNDEFYILSHEEFRTPLENRAAEIARSFDAWAAFRADHGV